MTLTETVAIITLTGSLGSSTITAFVAIKVTERAGSDAKSIAVDQMDHDSDQRALDRNSALEMIKAQAYEGRIEHAYVSLQELLVQIQAFADSIIFAGDPESRQPPSLILDVDRDPLVTLTMSPAVRTAILAVCNDAIGVQALWGDSSYWWQGRKDGLADASASYITSRNRAREGAQALRRLCDELSTQLRKELGAE